MMIPVRMRSPYGPAESAVRPLLVSNDRSRSTRMSAGGSGRRARPPFRPDERIRRVLDGCGVRDPGSRIADSALELFRPGLPPTTGRALREMSGQPSGRDSGRKGLLVEAGGERGPGAGAEHVSILPDPGDEQRGEERHA